MEPQKKQIIIFFLKMCIFSVMFLSMFVILHKVFLAKDDNLYNYINFTEQAKESIDILVLGSSHAMDGIDARELDCILSEEYGIEGKTFNMSVTGMRMEQIGYRFKEALKTQTPSVLIIETFSCLPTNTGNKETIDRWAIDYIPLSRDKAEYIYTDMDESLQTSFLVPFIKYHSRWDELTKEDWAILSPKKVRSRSQNAGFVAPDKPDFQGTWDDYFQQDFTLIIEEMELTEHYREIIQEIIETCEEIGCKVLFLSIPYKVQADFNAIELVKYNNYIVREYVDDENVYMYDMQKLVGDLNWGYEHMADEGHVNNFGREVVDRQLAGIIKEIWRE